MQVNVTTVPAVFTFAPDLTLRVYDTEGNPWFVAVDIERMFGISNIRKRVASLDEDERSAVPAPQGGSPLTVVNESGLWTLVLRSDAALQKGTAAYKARKWVTSEVLPAIRRTGRYETAQSAIITTTEQYEIPQGHQGASKEQLCSLPDGLQRSLRLLQDRELQRPKTRSDESCTHAHRDMHT